MRDVEHLALNRRDNVEHGDLRSGKRECASPTRATAAANEPVARQPGYLLFDESPRQAEPIRELSSRYILLVGLEREENDRPQRVVEALWNAHD